MSDLYPVIGMIFVAAITPGPNNILVLETSLRGGVKGAVPVISGIILGSVAIFFLTLIGLAQMMEPVPIANNIIAALGSLYLIYLGANLFWTAGLTQGEPMEHRLPRNTLGVVLFQFINPKTWVLLSTVISTTYHSLDWPVMVIVLITVTTICLMIWASVGLALSSIYCNPMIRKVFEKAMALSLILLAVGILYKAVAGF